MTNYPNAQDNNITLPGVSGASQEDIAINALRDATFAIEKELGITPSGVYSDVRARFDILEARINNPVSPTILSDGYVNSPFYIVNTPASVTLSISDGNGAPTENRVSGSLYMRADGYANNELYIRRGSQWFPIQSDVWVAAGDLAGTYNNQTVIGIRGKLINASAASVGATQDGYHLTWNNGDGYWEAQTGFIPGRDLAISAGPYGRTAQTVIGLQNRNLSSAAPAGTNTNDGDSLAWDSTVSQWQPRARAIIYDGYVDKSNIRSTKLAQSPIDNTKTGIVNFGSRSAGASVGVVANYGAILSGDRNVVTADYGSVVGGDSNIVSGQYASILDGYSNTALAVNAIVLNGGNNTAGGQYSSVLNGVSNTISVASTHAAIGFGSSNQITGTAIYSIIIGGSGNTASALNSFLGAPSSSTVNSGSNYGTVLNGLSNTIGTNSTFSSILNGNTNSISTGDNYSWIGGGNNNATNGQYSIILNGTGSTVSGFNSTVINGNNNSASATYNLVGTGNNNTAGGGVYAAVLDGYGNTAGGDFSLILNGANNLVGSSTNGTILNGYSNTLRSVNSTLLNGNNNTVDINSANITILNGATNNISTTDNAVVNGNTNTITSANNSYVFGSSNSVQSSSTKVIGSSNTIGTGGAFNRIFGNTNTIGNISNNNSVLGNNNQLTNGASTGFIAGAGNFIDTATSGSIIGTSNIVTSNFGTAIGQFGKSRLYGQVVQASSRFTAGKIGEAQWSRLVLSGTGTSGAAISLQLQDSSPVNPTFVDGYSYEMSIRVLVVNTSSIGPNPVVPARYIFDVLAHQEGGNLILDNVNQTLITPQASGTPWTVTVSTSANQLTITVDVENTPPYVQPTNTPSSRRAIATIEMREISRL